ncbi:unnamed protein product [Prunus armeniaca]
MPELKDTSKLPTKKSLLDQKLGGLLFVPYLTTYPRRDTWSTLKAESSSSRPWRMFLRHSLPILGSTTIHQLPTSTFGMVCRATNGYINLTLTDRLRTPARTCQSTCRSPKTLPRIPLARPSVRIQPPLEPSDITEEGHPGPQPSAYL